MFPNLFDFTHFHQVKIQWNPLQPYRKTHLLNRKRNNDHYNDTNGNTCSGVNNSSLRSLFLLKPKSISFDSLHISNKVISIPDKV